MKENNVPSNSNTDVTPVASHSCTVTNLLCKGDICTLSDKELIDKGREWIKKLCKSGGNAWTLQVPVNYNEDPDMIFSELINRFKVMLNKEQNPDECDATKADKR